MDVRLDRFATLYLVSPCLRFAAREQSSVPILMYHSISDQDESNVHPYYRTSTSPKMFVSQLEYLHQSGYRTCNLEEALNQLQLSSRTAAKSVIITFDDGYSDFYRRAFPVLSQYGFGATVFLPTAYIGDSPLQFKGRDCLTWAEVRELSNYGILFGSHTVSHPQLRELSVRAINEEIIRSKLTIEEKLGRAVDSFAYPFAFPQAEADFAKMLRDSLSQAGYQNGVCTIIGRAHRNSDRFFMERLPINSWDDTRLFKAKLKGGYDWLQALQGASKFIRARRVSSD